MLIRRAIFGKDSFRFAGMLGASSCSASMPMISRTLGSFVALYKMILNALPIVLPVTPSSPLPSPFEDDEEEKSGFVTPLEIPLSERQPRLSLSVQAHQQWVRKKTRRWHAVAAGAIAGGAAIMFEKRSRRLIIAQQLFVRFVPNRPCTMIGLLSVLQWASGVV